MKNQKYHRKNKIKYIVEKCINIIENQKKKKNQKKIY